MTTTQNRNEILASDTDGDIVNGLFQGFAQFLVLENALKTDILDQIEKEPTAVSIATLSQKYGYNPDILERLLDNLASMKLVQKCGDDGNWKYFNTKASSVYLTKASPSYKGDALQSDKALLEKTSSNLRYTLKTGPGDQLKKFVESGKISNMNINKDATEKNSDENQNINVDIKNTMPHDMAKTNLNSPQNKIQSNGDLDSSPSGGQHRNSLQVLMKSMDSMMYSCRHVIPKAFDLSGHRVAVDLGGGSGYLARLLTDFYPQLTTTVFELPPVVALARSAHEQNQSNDRVLFTAGDFFQDELPPADLYILSRVLHGINESRIYILLEKIYRSLPPGGKLLILEKFLNDRKDGPGYIMNVYLNMSSFCDGRERTVDEYERLVERNGYTNTRYKTIEGINLFDALLTSKPF